MRGLLLFLLLGVVSTVQAAITAQLDRQQSALGSPVSLIIKATEGDDIGQPNLVPLQQDFRVLGQMSSSETHIVNFDTTHIEKLTIRLLPRHTGKLVIPPLHTPDGNTPQLTLTVTDAAHNPKATANPNLFLSVTASPASIYVGQQTTLTVKLFYSTRINKGHINPPKLKQASIQPLGSSKQYTSRRNGKLYQVYEQQYALFPSQAGDITIPAFVFNGSRLVSQPRNFFGMQISGFGRPKPVTAASQPLALHVKPIPDSWSGMWLPAEDVTLTASGLPKGDTVKAGVPINLTLTLMAKGLAANSLPELSLPDIDNASVYKDKAKHHNGRDGLLITSKRQRQFAILPQQPGKLVIPATQIVWFNTRTQQKEIAKIPARSFTVVAGTKAGNTPKTPQTTRVTPSSNQAAASHAPTTTSTKTPAKATKIDSLQHQVTWWRRAFFASILLWLLLVIILFVRRHKKPAVAENKPGAPPKKRQLRRQFFRQLQQKDPQLLASLLQWASRERDGITTREQLKQALVDEQSAQVLLLENWCYGGGSFPDSAASYFRKGLQWRDQQGDNKSSDDTDMLPSLYPPDGR